jgi:uncharacterized protein YbjT (DUF2867 family)
MKVCVIGANGKIGAILVQKLIEKGHHTRAMVRDEGQRRRHEGAGAEVVLGDLEGDFEHALEGMDAVVFTAGSGAHTGKDKTLLVDLWGALKTYPAAKNAHARRYVMVSALRAGDPDEAGGGIKPYLVAKCLADDYLEKSGLDYTILRPGGLSDEPGTGTLQAATHLERRSGKISREDVAEAIVAALEEDATIGKTVEMLGGDTPIRQALLEA